MSPTCCHSPRQPGNPAWLSPTAVAAAFIRRLRREHRYSVIPSNADQQLSTAVLAESGAGLGVRVEEASKSRLGQALRKTLVRPQYRSSAQQWATVYARYDSGVLFRKFVDDALTAAPLPGVVPE